MTICSCNPGFVQRRGKCCSRRTIVAKIPRSIHYSLPKRIGRHLFFIIIIIIILQRFTFPLFLNGGVPGLSRTPSLWIAKVPNRNFSKWQFSNRSSLAETSFVLICAFADRWSKDQQPATIISSRKNN